MKAGRTIRRGGCSIFVIIYAYTSMYDSLSDFLGTSVDWYQDGRCSLGTSVHGQRSSSGSPCWGPKGTAGRRDDVTTGPAMYRVPDSDDNCSANTAALRMGGMVASGEAWSCATVADGGKDTMRRGSGQQGCAPLEEVPAGDESSEASKDLIAPVTKATAGRGGPLATPWKLAQWPAVGNPDWQLA